MGIPEDTNKDEAKDVGARDDSPAPAYTTQGGLPLPAIDLSKPAGPAEYTTITHGESIAHLKFLAVLFDLRDAVTRTSNLFGIPDPTPRQFSTDINKAWALVKEKRWAVYTAKAVARYTEWWNKCITPSRPRPSIHAFTSAVYEDITVCQNPLVWTRDELPPLDVLMVWHAHMLNPRAFLEDCMRHGKMSLWAAGFPWEAINSCIDEQTMLYDAGATAAMVFTSTTNLKWDNLDDMPSKMIICPRCDYANSAPWTKGKLSLPLDQAFESWNGFTDKYFGMHCAQCFLSIKHETLRLQKFKTDVKELLQGHIPMPGTLYNVYGVPEQLDSTRRAKEQQDFPNRLLRAAKRDLREYLKSSLWICPSVSMLRDYLSTLMKDREVMRAATATRIYSLYPEEKIAFRRMMSRYWENSSPFALDLVGAVIRQGTFIQKMENLDWLHSPTLSDTTHRLIRKYAVFFQIMSSNPGHMAVPTLDVDLAWHTHQLSPHRYFTYSLHRTKQDGKRAVLIDHDDKVSEIKLSDGFEWTAKMYRKLTDGGVYSECTCWYCEATRSSDLGPRFLPSSSSATKARAAAESLHTNPCVSQDPSKNAHISAHSAVKTKPDASTLASGTDPNHVKFLKLRSEYAKARRRAEKRNPTGAANGNGREKSKDKDENKDDDPNGTVYTTYPLMWGYPVYVPYYGPYTTDPSVHCDVYPSDPACMSLAPGCPGNCAAGTCGGSVAAGNCGGRGGGCAGGCAGSSTCTGGGCGSSGVGGGSGDGGGGGGDGGGGGGGGCGGGS
ncbi:hypothetical protein BJY04DRAFT_223577 [Aspergillus karnatakaensis]|uniref:uncharacterized protein n=1 Tax=Aspergillus karnatakaensis TaxID=1810916 RepID=UPI003CCD1CA1